MIKKSSASLKYVRIKICPISLLCLKLLTVCTSLYLYGDIYTTKEKVRQVKILPHNNFLSGIFFLDTLYIFTIDFHRI